MAKAASYPGLVGVFFLLTLPCTASATEEAQLWFSKTPHAKTCGSRELLSSMVAARLGRDPFSAAADRLIRISVDRIEARYVANISVESVNQLRSAERQLEHARCDELYELVALSVAVAIDPMALETLPLTKTATPAREETGPVSPPPPEPPPPEGPVETVTFETPTLVLRRFGVGWAAGGGLQPGIYTGPFAFFQLIWPTLSAGLELAVNLPSSVDLGQNLDVSAYLVSGVGTACFRPAPLSFCGLIGGAILRAAGNDLDDARTATAPGFIFGARVALEIELTEDVLGLELSLDLRSMLPSTTLEVSAAEVWTASIVGARLGAALTFDYQ